MQLQEEHKGTDPFNVLGREIPFEIPPCELKARPPTTVSMFDHRFLSLLISQSFQTFGDIFAWSIADWLPLLHRCLCAPGSSLCGLHTITQRNRD